MTRPSGLWRRHVAITARAFVSFAGRHTSALVIGGGVLVLGAFGAFLVWVWHLSMPGKLTLAAWVLLSALIYGILTRSQAPTPHEPHRELTWTGGAR